MVEIELDWEKIKTIDNFYGVFLPQVGAPEWHGRNLDALNDSLVTGGINKLEPPYSIVNINSSEAGEGICEEQKNIFSIFQEAVLANRKIELIIK